MLKKTFCLLGMLVLITGCDLIDSQISDDQLQEHYGKAVTCGENCGGFCVKVGDRVFFDADKSNLTPEARLIVASQAKWLKKYLSVKVIVEGHTDERGTREHNHALGERRAKAVKNYLISLGVNADRIKTISHGKERPAVPGSDEKTWAQNRRAVTIVIVPK